tara:strand:- start:298 stop:918 length:621 start_codon:yes stop_codon:yes gene_type:complete
VVSLLPTSAVLDPELTDGAVRVLAALSAHGSWDYLWDFSTKALSDVTMWTPRMINRYRQELLNAGYIDRDGRLIALADATAVDYQPSTQGAHLATKTPVKPKIGVMKIDDAKFEEFWVLYPRKEGKASAKKAWVKAIGVIKKTSDDPERYLKEMTQRYRNHVDSRSSRDRKFVPHAATWLNGERWTDDFLQRQEDDVSGSLSPQTL